MVPGFTIIIIRECVFAYLVLIKKPWKFQNGSTAASYEKISYCKKVRNRIIFMKFKKEFLHIQIFIDRQHLGSREIVTK